MSDYLMDAPVEVMESLSRTIFTKIRGTEDAFYEPEVCDWVTSREFRKAKQPMYISRCRGLTLSTRGMFRDLNDSYGRLVDQGLVERDPEVYMGWGPTTTSRFAGASSVLMKVVNMSQSLDSENVPEEVLDYCVYAHLSHIGMGFRAESPQRELLFNKELNRFPGRAHAMYMMEQLGIKV
ncbi:MAG: hypothetical protein ACI38Y_07385 [Candidatus Methanomethylophilaceae archaeon]